MKVIKFLKGLQIKKTEALSMTLDELDSFMLSKTEALMERLRGELDEVKGLMREEKSKALANVEKLSRAALHNPNIPDRVLDVVEGNRQQYAQKVQALMSFEFASEVEEVLAAYDSFESRLDEFGKSTTKNYQILSDFFANDVHSIAANIKRLDSLAKRARDIVAKSGVTTYIELRGALDEIKNRIKAIADMTREMRRMKEDIEDESGVIRAREAEISRLEQTEEYE